MFVSRHVLNAESTGFADALSVRYERNKDIRDDFQAKLLEGWFVRDWNLEGCSWSRFVGRSGVQSWTC